MVSSFASTPYRQVIRATTVLLATGGRSDDEIDVRLDIPRRIVSTGRHRFNQDHVTGTDEGLRGGRRAHLSPNVVIEVKRIGCERPMEAGRPLGHRSLPNSRRGREAEHRRTAPTPSLGPVVPGRALRVEHERQRRGAWVYLAVWDVVQSRLFGRCEARSGTATFDRLVEQVVAEVPSRAARWALEFTGNGLAHFGVSSDT